MHAHDLELLRDRPAKVSSIEAPRQGTATVAAVAESGWLLTLADGSQRSAAQAASCLLQPAVGDRVWFVAEADSAYVLAVLERRAPETPAELHIDGDAALQVGGALRITGASVDLQGQQRLSMQADEVQVRGRLGKLLLDEGSMILRSLFSHVGKATFVAKVIERFSERFSAHSKTSLRMVEDVDLVQAGNIDYRAEHAMQVTAEHALIRAGELVKVDGGQIHLG